MMSRRSSQTQNDMRVISVDPGYGRIGIAILEKEKGKEKLVFSECFETDAKEAQAMRLAQIKTRLGELIAEFKPEALAIETLFFSKNQKTAMGVAEARGVITSEAAAQDLLVFEYRPSEVKIAVTGYGSADKRQVKEMVKKILKVEKEIKLDDEYDAIAVGLTHLAISRGN